MNKTIRFLMDYTVRAAGGKTFKKGETVTLPLQSARHFVSRGRAEYVDPLPVPQPENQPEPEAVKRGPGRPPKVVSE